MLFANIHRFVLAGSAVFCLAYIGLFAFFGHSHGAYESRSTSNWWWFGASLVIVGAQLAWHIKPSSSSGTAKTDAPTGPGRLADEDIDAIIARHTKGQLPGTSLSTPNRQPERRVTPERRSAQRNSTGFGRRNA